MEGILNLNKPSGISSFGAVRKVRFISKEKKVGHGGTLDPLASGVLPIFVGKATKYSGSFLNSSKEYKITIVLGKQTTTSDSEGETTDKAPFSSVTYEAVVKALEGLKGKIEQVPPMYSALKHKGVRLYKLARKGIEVERKPREVEVLSYKLIKFVSPTIEVVVSCSKGFYARVYASDVGEALGTKAYMGELVRLKSGSFKIEDSISLSKIELFSAEELEKNLISMNSVQI